VHKIYELTKVAWDKITAESTQKALKKCGISNAMDGIEDE
jgi:hypothetical protein